MLREKFNDDLNLQKENLLNSDQIKVLLDEFNEEISADEKIYATLAYDSATVDGENSKGNNLYIFNMQLVKGILNSKILHILQHTVGRSDESIKKISHQIIKEGI